MPEPLTIENLRDSYNKLSLGILDAQRQMVKGIQSPAQMANIRSEMAGTYGWGTGQMPRLEKHRTQYFNKHREAHKSDKACETAWLSTPEGELYTDIKYMLKGLEKMISALKSLIDTHQYEYNYYKSEK